MEQITLTCVACGATVTVDDTPENRRKTKCKDCDEPMVERRQPGGKVTTVTPSPPVSSMY